MSLLVFITISKRSHESVKLGCLVRRCFWCMWKCEVNVILGTDVFLRDPHLPLYFKKSQYCTVMHYIYCIVCIIMVYIEDWIKSVQNNVCWGCTGNLEPLAIQVTRTSQGSCSVLCHVITNSVPCWKRT